MINLLTWRPQRHGFTEPTDEQRSYVPSCRSGRLIHWELKACAIEAVDGPKALRLPCLRHQPQGPHMWNTLISKRARWDSGSKKYLKPIATAMEALHQWALSST